MHVEIDTVRFLVEPIGKWNLCIIQLYRTTLQDVFVEEVDMYLICHYAALVLNSHHTAVACRSDTYPLPYCSIECTRA